MPVTSQTNEIKIIREYDAPVKSVWDAWANPEEAAQWWGPRGFTITTHSKDLKVGGNWTYTMHGPNGVDYPNRTDYFEVEPLKKLVYDHGAAEGQKPLFRVVVTFTEYGTKTKMDMSMILPTPEAAERTRSFIKDAGGDATWDRLAEYLEKKISGKDKFVINRSFETSIERMFEMWTDPQQFSQWIAPTGFNTEYKRANITPGGSSFYCMTNGQIKMYGRAEYKKIEKPNVIVYTQQFCDENENITRHPMAATWPETMLTAIHLTTEEPNRTRVTITWEPYGTVTAEELQTFIGARGGMTQGWTGSLDKLEEHLLKS
jgi:uncharacterized protein YndB with AHSA1/START domain